MPLPALIFIGGVSAVGKSTLLARIPDRDRAWLWWSAGKLIADELKVTELPTADTADVLRYQEALVREYRRRSRGIALPIAMDGHFTLPTNRGRFAVPVEVFRMLAPRALVLLGAAPEDIKQRMGHRDGDARVIAQIADGVAAEAQAARAIVAALGVELHDWSVGKETVAAFTALLRGLRT